MKRAQVDIWGRTLQPQLAISMSYIQLNNNSLSLFPSLRCAKEPQLQCCERAHLSSRWGGVCAQLAHLVFNNEPGDSLGSCCCRSVRLDKIQSLFCKVSNFPPFCRAALSDQCLSKQLWSTLYYQGPLKTIPLVNVVMATMILMISLEADWRG